SPISIHPPSFPTRRSSDLTARVYTLLPSDIVRSKQTSQENKYSMTWRILLPLGPRCENGATESLTEPLARRAGNASGMGGRCSRSEEHTSELQSRVDLVCR